jgi:cold shock CspA family protein
LGGLNVEGFGFITPDDEGDEESAVNADSDAPKKEQLKGAQAVYVRLQDEAS